MHYRVRFGACGEDTLRDRLRALILLEIAAQTRGFPSGEFCAIVTGARGLQALSRSRMVKPTSTTGSAIFPACCAVEQHACRGAADQQSRRSGRWTARPRPRWRPGCRRSRRRRCRRDLHASRSRLDHAGVRQPVRRSRSRYPPCRRHRESRAAPRARAGSGSGLSTNVLAGSCPPSFTQARAKRLGPLARPPHAGGEQ